MKGKANVVLLVAVVLALVALVVTLGFESNRRYEAASLARLGDRARSLDSQRESYRNRSDAIEKNIRELQADIRNFESLIDDRHRTLESDSVQRKKLVREAEELQRKIAYEGEKMKEYDAVKALLVKEHDALAKRLLAEDEALGNMHWGEPLADLLQRWSGEMMRLAEENQRLRKEAERAAK